MVLLGTGVSQDADVPASADIHSKSVNQHREAEKSRSGHNSEKMGCKLSSRFCRSKQYSDDCEAAETTTTTQAANNTNADEKYRDSICEIKNSHDVNEDENCRRYNNHSCISCPCISLGGRKRERRRINSDEQDDGGNTCQIKIEPENFPSPQTPENIYSFGLLRGGSNFDPSKTKALLCTAKEDATWVGINAAVDKLGFIKEVANTIETALILFQNTYHSLVLIDVRSRNFDGEKLCR